MKQSFRSGRRAFTLVELIVIVVIIGLLCAIVLGSVPMMMKRARSITCLQNLRSFGLAFSYYKYDNNGKLPTMNQSAWFNQAGWCDALSNTLGPIWQSGFRNEVYYCPYRVQAGQPVVNPSYEANTRLSGLPTTAVSHPSDAVLLECGVHRLLATLSNSVPMLFVDMHAAFEPWPATNAPDPWTYQRNRGF